MRIAVVIVAVLAMGALSGCRQVPPRQDVPYRLLAGYAAPVIPPQGLLYSNYHAPIVPVDQATSFGSKSGSAVSFQIALPPLPFPGLATGVQLFGWGDASLRTAARNGELSEVLHSDYELQVYLLFFRRFTMHVYGE